MYDLLKEFIPNDHSRQVNSMYYIKYVLGDNDIRWVMDLGCGAGNLVDYFRRKDPSIRWVGLDIEESPEVMSRTKTDADFYRFDGIHIPFDDNYFDLIYCNQVLEHVRYPSDLLKEVYRVLRHNGHFVGSTSQLEPYHSYSLWNYTPYGFRLLIEEAGLQLIEIRPSIDALTLIIRCSLANSKIFSHWWGKESPLNQVISFFGKMMRKRSASVNAVKLLFCGHFCFLVRKSDATPESLKDDTSLIVPWC